LTSPEFGEISNGKQEDVDDLAPIVAQTVAASVSAAYHNGNWMSISRIHRNHQ